MGINSVHNGCRGDYLWGAGGRIRSGVCNKSDKNWDEIQNISGFKMIWVESSVFFLN